MPPRSVERALEAQVFVVVVDLDDQVFGAPKDGAPHGELEDPFVFLTEAFVRPRLSHGHPSVQEGGGDTGRPPGSHSQARRRAVDTSTGELPKCADRSTRPSSVWLWTTRPRLIHRFHAASKALAPFRLRASPAGTAW